MAFARYPQIAQFILDADQLPTPGQLETNRQFALVALLHCADDPFIGDPTGRLIPAYNRLAAHKVVQIQPYTGQVPSGTPRRKRQEPQPGDWLAEHKVRRGETLSHLAKHYYDSARLWPLIYNANRSMIGANPNYLQPGWLLKIPHR
ncbi:MAG: LysM peptidoglycan-binding domain-containing protein [Caldilineaceae bacterium]